MPGPELNRRQILALGAAGLAGLTLPRPARAEPSIGGWKSEGLSGRFTLSNATVVLHTGEKLEGAGIRVEDGRVAEVGKGVRGGEDMGGRWLVPGFTDAGCLVGLVEIGMEEATHDKNESSDPVTPDARVWDAYNPLSEVVPVTRAHGITSVLVHPEPSRLVAGQAALFHTAGRTPQEALVQAPAGLLICLGHAGTGEMGPQTRMGVSMRLREILEEVKLPDEEGEQRKKKKKAEPDEDLPPAQLAWQKARQGRLPVLFRAERADDLLTAIELTRAYKLKATILGGAEAWLVAPELAAAKMPVLLGPLTVQPDSFEHPHARYDNAARLHEAGVPFAFRTGSAHFSRGLSTSAGLAVAHGLPWVAAIHALTSAPGEILGIEGHGRLESGGPATFFVIGGDPLQPRFPVERLWIGGREASLDNRQRRLYRQYRNLW